MKPSRRPSWPPWRSCLARAPGVRGGPGAAATPAAPAPPARTDGVISGQVESFALRVEYDLPLPAGSGTVAHVSGEVRRSPAGENAKGIAAGAPTEMDAVVGGKYIDPQGTGHPVRRTPQTECFYPGSLLDTHFFFPTDTQGETSGHAADRLRDGAVRARPRGRAALGLGQRGRTGNRQRSAGAGAHHGSRRRRRAGPARSRTRSTRRRRRARRTSRSSGGAVKIGSVVASGHSSTTGQPGGGASRAAISINDIDAGGVTFGVVSAIVERQGGRST